MNEAGTLIDGAGTLGIALSENDAARLLRLLDELAHWNRSYNLTAITDRAKMITHHLLDSLSIHSDLYGSTVADVGTGAGFPGLPLAVVDPDRHFTLIDSNSKKIRFVAHAARVLELANVTPLHDRVGTMRLERPFDSVVVRAFAPLAALLKYVEPLCGLETRVLAMKGKRPDPEIATIPSNWRVVEIRPLSVPGLTEARCVLLLQRHNSLPGA